MRPGKVRGAAREFAGFAKNVFKTKAKGVKQ